MFEDGEADADTSYLGISFVHTSENWCFTYLGERVPAESTALSTAIMDHNPITKLYEDTMLVTTTAAAPASCQSCF
jgi:hypothetical protein